MVPPAPGRFSITTGWPSCAVSLSETVRAMMSVPLPGVNGTINLTVLVGQACAHAADCAAHRAIATAAIHLIHDCTIRASLCIIEPERYALSSRCRANLKEVYLHRALDAELVQE